MIIKKFLFHRMATWMIIGILASCKNVSDNGEVAPPQTVFKQPVIKPLKFSGTKKIDWAGIKPVSVQPFVDKFDTSKFPVQPYDTSGFKPVAGPVEEAKFDYNSLPSKDFDIDKLPAHKLRFKTYFLPPPQLIKAGPPGIKNVNSSIHDFLGMPKFKNGDFITCLYVDLDGFLWIATAYGLYRYDGENLWLHITLKPSHFIVTMAQDRQGRIWMNEQDNGIDIMDITKGTLKKTGQGNGLTDKDIMRVVPDKQQRLWVICRHAGINIIDPQTETVKWLGTANGLSAPRATDVIQDDENNVWIGTVKGVDVIDLENKKIKYLDKNNYLKTDTMIAIIQDHDKRIWLGGYHGEVSIIDFKKGNIQSKKEKRIWNFYQFNKNVWKVLENGVEITDTKNNMAMQLNATNGLDDPSVRELARDKQGQVWIGTNNGLNMVSADKAIIDHINTRIVSTLAEDKDGLFWLGTGRGIDIINRKTKTLRHFTIHHGPDDDSVSTINEINGSIFICSRKGLDIIDPSRTSITHLGKEQGINSKKTQAVLVDDQGRIWIGGRENGIDVYDPVSKTVKHLGKPQGLSGNEIQDIKADTHGRIWISTISGGVDIIDPKTWILKNISFDYSSKPLLPDDEGNMWIGTENIKSGIFIADLKNNTLTNFSTPQGLIDPSVNSLLKHNNHIYASMDDGITIITPPANRISANDKWGVESFGKSYGINKFELTACLTDMITRDGLYCWGDTGITVLNLSKKDTAGATAFITGITVMDQPDFFTDHGAFELHDKDTLWDPNSDKYYTKGETAEIAGYPHGDRLSWEKVTGPYNMPVNWTLRHDQNSIRFNYSTLNLKDHDTTWYKYRLIGADKDWSDATTSGSSKNYFSLTPGDYTFEVSSKNADKAWSNPAYASFIIDPPWWQTWWAYIIYVCLFAGSTWCFVYYRSRQLVKEKRVLEHKVHIRTEEVLQQKEEIESQRDGLEKAFKELKTTQTQLIQSEKMASLGELTAGIAHEIQNPLNFVNNFSEVSRELMEELREELDKGDTEEVKAISLDVIQNLEKINHHGKRADGIVKGMLEHSRSSSGSKEPTDINKLADEYMRLAYHGLRAKDKSFNAEMITNFDPGLPKINVAQQDIGRVFLNLFNNAFYAVNQKLKTAGADYKPEVIVTTSTENGQAIIKVKDNGVGIPDAIKEKIMQPFFTTKPTGEGTGLGLSLTYDMVVKGHGGNIQVNSKEGEGSEFIISLPI